MDAGIGDNPSIFLHCSRCNKELKLMSVHPYQDSSDVIWKIAPCEKCSTKDSYICLGDGALKKMAEVVNVLTEVIQAIEMSNRR